MRTKTILFVILLVLLVQGCTVVSFYPLYTEDTIMENDRIIGVWENSADDDIWEISQPDTLKNSPITTVDHNWANNKYSYIAKVYHSDEPEMWAKFLVHLVNLGNNIYADIYPTNWSFDMDFLMAHQISVHSFAKVDLDSTISVTWMNPEWMDELIKQNKISIPYVEDEEERIILLSKPIELQKFLINYEDDESVFDDLTWELTRVNEEEKENK